MIIMGKKTRIGRPEDVAKIMMAILDSEHFIDQNKEHFWVIGVNIKNVMQYIELVALGSLNFCSVSPREIFRFAIIKGVAGIIAVHNHPSGDPEPSEDDIRITKKLVEAGSLLEIEVLDHVIIGDMGAFVSLKERGVI